ncbi:MAG: hypothetical protein FD187_839 [bacterium]|nr:MAG: hypothetical protein FD142_584 [bacterium]KAF0149882.1 MAG: hypothetical protein FD187_839 [bacterium]KAF0166344.1 MAG: hypothetical protein FD158_2628 [bacterium]TXT16166.1 MAG: hypothetical protein FD132_2968 [bacterium]
MKRSLVAVLALSLAAPALAQQAAAPAPANPYLQHVPITAGPMVLPVSPGGRGTRPYEMSRIVPPEEKDKLMKQMMPMMGTMTRMDVKDVMNLMAIKYKAKPGLTFDDVKQSMELRANQLNFKKVGESPMWKDIQAVLGDKDAPRMEVYHYCDIAAGRAVLQYAPESIVYLPCRIAIMEDADKQIWVLTLDWNTAWLDSISGKMGAPDELMKQAKDIRDKMDVIMRAAADGEI